MATQKIINNKPIKNNGGVVYSEGTLSSLSPISRSTQEFDNTITGPKGGSFTFQGGKYFKTIDIDNPNNKVFVNQDKFYISYASGISYVTGQPTETVLKTGSFWANQRKRFNNLSGFVFSVGDQTKFRDDSNLQPPTYGLLKSSLVNGKQALSFSLNNSKNFFPRKMFSIYTGEVSPSNQIHDKTYQVEYVKDGQTSSTFTYDLDAWHKLNVLTTSNNSVNITCLNESGVPFYVGFRDFSEATQLNRTVSLTTYQSNPYTFMGDVNVTLSSDEKAVRVTSGDTAQLMFLEVDNEGKKSPVVYSIIPSGAKLTYYPSYSKIAIGEVQGRSLTVEVLK